MGVDFEMCGLALSCALEMFAEGTIIRVYWERSRVSWVQEWEVWRGWVEGLLFGCCLCGRSSA